MGKRLIIKNLALSTKARDLGELFLKYGNVISIKMMKGQGIAFVEMFAHEEAVVAKSALNNITFKRHRIQVEDDTSEAIKIEGNN